MKRVPVKVVVGDGGWSDVIGDIVAPIPSALGTIYGSAQQVGETAAPAVTPAPIRVVPSSSPDDGSGFDPFDAFSSFGSDVTNFTAASIQQAEATPPIDLSVIDAAVKNAQATPAPQAPVTSHNGKAQATSKGSTDPSTYTAVPVKQAPAPAPSAGKKSVPAAKSVWANFPLWGKVAVGVGVVAAAVSLVRR